MPIPIRWKASFSATVLHAAHCMHSGIPAADAELAAQLAEPAQALLGELQSACGEVDRPLGVMLGLASDFENNRQLAEVMLAKLLGQDGISSVRVNQLAGRLSDLEAALLRSQPRVVDELAVRGGPLQEAWEGRGPGLLRQIGRLTDERIVVPQAEVVLVAPYAGGAGTAHLQQNRVTFEAVLVNPHDDLPEVLRLAWLLAQLNLDLPIFSEVVTPGRIAVVGQLAMLPPLLDAADEVQLARYHTDLLKRAVEVWRLDTAGPADLVDRLDQWWSALRESQTAWTVALAALDQMLQA